MQDLVIFKPYEMKGLDNTPEARIAHPQAQVIAYCTKAMKSVLFGSDYGLEHALLKEI